jgi:molybdopterin/thiamine biosynthesis adenylyltransferase
VVGVGALGSNLVPLIRNIEPRIRVVDFDRVERKNVLSQFHSVKSPGKRKATALAQLMKFTWSTVIEPNTNKVTSDNVREILGGASLVVDCLDNGAGRRVVQDFVREAVIPCVHGGLAADGEFARVIWDESFVIDPEPAEGQATCEDGEFLPFIGIAASYLAFAVQGFLNTGTKRGFNIHHGGANRS